MPVPLFGAASSPSCSNFGLKTTAADNEGSLGSTPAEFCVATSMLMMGCSQYHQERKL